MQLKANKTYMFCFDLETTGPKFAKDRIVEIAILKVYPNGIRRVKSGGLVIRMEIPAEVV